MTEMRSVWLLSDVCRRVPGSFHCRCEADEGEGARGLGGAATAGGGDVGLAGVAEEADGRSAHGLSWPISKSACLGRESGCAPIAMVQAA